MADREKVKKGLECCTLTVKGCDPCPTECPYYGKCMGGVDRVFFDLMEDALSLLKEQEPIKPLIKGHGEFEEEGSWWYECGNCGTPIDPEDKYCRKCGKAVKWDDNGLDRPKSGD